MVCVEEKDGNMVKVYLVNMFGGQTVLKVSRLPHHTVPVDLLLLLQSPQPLQDPAGEAREMHQLPFLQIAEQINRILGDF